LRLRSVRDSAVGLTLTVLQQGELRATACLREVTVEPGRIADHGYLREQADEAEKQLSVATGKLIQATWLHERDGTQGSLILSLHHLLVDAVSWRILVADVQSALVAVASGAQPALEGYGTSFRRWSTLLTIDASSGKREAELPLWQDVLSRPDPLLSARPLDPTTDTIATVQRLQMILPTTLAEPLLGSVPAAFNAGVNDILLSTLALAVVVWRRRNRPNQTASDVLFNIEVHGREDIFEGVDLSRTVGWFTNLHPVRLDILKHDLNEALAGGPAMGGILKDVKEQLRRIPDRGIGYGILRYLNSTTKRKFDNLACPQIGFNYLGRMRSSEPLDPASRLASGGISSSRDPRMHLIHAIDVDALTYDGPAGPQLVASWAWAGNLFQESTIRQLAEGWFAALGALAKHATGPDAGGLTPSDIPLTDLNQNDIDRLEKMLRRK
jgi:non-ribosomal peptide synthase protein (TIGR01720 family)